MLGVMKLVIQNIQAKEIKDSRGNPTLRVTLTSNRGVGTADVPSGASVGSREAHELRDADGGMNAAKAAAEGAIASMCIGNSFDQLSLDQALVELDNTEHRTYLGGNTLLGVSMAFARAAATEMALYTYLASIAETTPRLPCPMFNLINGGKHANSGLDLQEFLFVPDGVKGTSAQIAAAEGCMKRLHNLLEQRGLSTALGDEGGFAPRMQSNEEALEILAEASLDLGPSRLSVDAAANSFFTDNAYHFRCGKEQSLSRDELTNWYIALAERFNVLSIEDAFAEDDLRDFASLQAHTTALLVGDDLTVTNAKTITAAAESKAIKAVIIKPNQAGTVSEAIEAVHAARAAGLVCIASHRSGETNDTFIADFSVGLGCEYLKAGAPRTTERMVKYNRLTEIATELE